MSNPAPKAPQDKSPYEGVFPSRAVVTVGTETSNTINVTVQLQTGGLDLWESGAVFMYLSDNADGSTLTATAPSGGWAIGTDGLLIPIVANKAANFISESDGDIDVTLTETGAATWYLVVVLPNGRLVISDAITFA